MTKQIKFYAKDQNGNKTYLDSNEIYAELSSGENISVEIPTQNKGADVILSCYHDEEKVSPKPGEKRIYTRMVVDPFAANTVGISLKTEEVDW